MNRREFIRNLTGGAAAVCGLGILNPLLDGKGSQGRTATLKGLHQANTDLSELLQKAQKRSMERLAEQMEILYWGPRTPIHITEVQSQIIRDRRPHGFIVYTTDTQERPA